MLSVGVCLAQVPCHPEKLQEPGSEEEHGKVALAGAATEESSARCRSRMSREISEAFPTSDPLSIEVDDSPQELPKAMLTLLMTLHGH